MTNVDEDHLLRVDPELNTASEVRAEGARPTTSEFVREALRKFP